MDKLSLLDWSGATHDLGFIGWTDASRTAFFVRTKDGERRAINLLLPAFFGLKFQCEAIPNLPVTKIIRTALHAPACFASETAAAKSDAQDSVGALLFKSAIGIRSQMLVPHRCHLEPTDRKALEVLLKSEKERLRNELLERERAIAAMPHEQEEEEKRLLPHRFTTVGTGNKLISVFDVTVEMVIRHNALGLRDPYLHQRWADQFGFDLHQISKDAAAFRRWVGNGAANSRLRSLDTGMESAMLNLTPGQWEILESAVRYEASFANSARCWLNDITERPIITPEEVDAFDKLEMTILGLTDSQVSIDEARRLLAKPGKRPISHKWLVQLCKRAGLQARFPMRHLDFERVRLRQQRAIRYQAEKATKNLPQRG